MAKLEVECPYCGAVFDRLLSICPYCGSWNLWTDIVSAVSTQTDLPIENSPNRSVVEINVKQDGILSFIIRDSWWWDLDLDGEQLYRISNGCETCSAIFSRVRDATLPISPQSLSKLLNEGLTFIPRDVIQSVSLLLPEGTYIVGLLRMQPKLLKGNVPEYSWGVKRAGYDKQARYEVVLPIVPEEVLDQRKVRDYEVMIDGGEEPTALALSILLEKHIMGTFLEWSLSHILLDGHHKLIATSNLSRPITMLSFLYTGPTRPSHTLGAGEGDIRRYYSGGELRLGRLNK